MEGNLQRFRELSANELSAYYFYVKYPLQRDVEISRRSGIKISTLVSAKKRLMVKELLKLRAFPFYTYDGFGLFSVIVVNVKGFAEGAIHEKLMEMNSSGRIRVLFSFSDIDTAVALLFASRYTDVFEAKRELWKYYSGMGKSIQIHDYTLLAEGMVVLNLFDYSPKVYNVLKEKIPEGLTSIERDLEEKGDNEVFTVGGTSGIDEDTKDVVSHLFRDPGATSVKLSRVLTMSRQRISRIRKRVIDDALLRMYASPFEGRFFEDIFTFYFFEFGRVIEKARMIEFYVKNREGLKKHNLLFFHSSDHAFMLNNYPNYYTYKESKFSTLAAMRRDFPDIVRMEEYFISAKRNFTYSLPHHFSSL